MSQVQTEQAGDKTQTAPTDHEEPLKPFDLTLEFEAILGRIKSTVHGVYAMRTDHEDKDAELSLLQMVEEYCDGIKDVGNELYTAYFSLNDAISKH